MWFATREDAAKAEAQAEAHLEYSPETGQFRQPLCILLQAPRR